MQLIVEAAVQDSGSVHPMTHTLLVRYSYGDRVATAESRQAVCNRGKNPFGVTRLVVRA